MILLSLVLWSIVSPAIPFAGQTPEPPVRIAILDSGNAQTAQRATAATARLLASNELKIVDGDLSHAAAHGVGYAGSLNLSVQEARDLGAAIGCDFYILGDSQTLRRASSTGPAYFEAYASLFLVSTRSGRLIAWERPNLEAPTPEAAEKLLLAQLSNDERRQRYLFAIRHAQEAERLEREAATERNIPII